MTIQELENQKEVLLNIKGLPLPPSDRIKQIEERINSARWSSLLTGDEKYHLTDYSNRLISEIKS